MRKVAIGLVVTLLLVSLIGIGSVSALSYKDKEIVVVNFDDLDATKVPDGKLSLGYAGIAWDTDWMIWNSPQAYYAAHSGDTRIHSHNFGGWINFSHDVEFKGAWIAGQPIGQISFAKARTASSKPLESRSIPSTRLRNPSASFNFSKHP